MKIRRISNNRFNVESSSKKGKFYHIDIEQPFCDCPDFMFREIKKHGKCKHIKAVEEYLKKKESKAEKKIKPKYDKVIAYVKNKKQVDSLELIEKFSEETVNELIQKGDLIEEKGKIKVLE